MGLFLGLAVEAIKGVGGRVPIRVVGRDGTLLVASGDSNRLEILGVLGTNSELPGLDLDLNMKGRKEQTGVDVLEVVGSGKGYYA